MWRRRGHSASLGSREDTSLCIGRDSEIRDIVDSVIRSGCVLLFGGRQAGKTTLLHGIAADLENRITGAPQSGLCRVPVFVNLMRLPYDAVPNDFFLLMAERAKEECERLINSFRVSSSLAFSRAGTLLGGFERRIQTLREGAVKLDLHLVFLVDEVKRILRGRFSRDFQDNLFTILFGDSPQKGCCNIVFAGAQELFLFSEEGTSPIGSRADRHFISGLSADSVRELLVTTCGARVPANSDDLGNLIYEYTGGHAGLSSELARRFADESDRDGFDPSTTITALQTSRSELFQIWINSLSPEARLINDQLLSLHRLQMGDVTRELEQRGFSRYRADRACRELQFTGIAKWSSASLEECNRIYSWYASRYAPQWEEEQKGSDVEENVWSLIRETELRMRKVIRRQFNERWKGAADDNIRAILGEDAWAEIIDRRSGYAKRYDARPDFEGTNDVLDFTYLGQLGQLMVSKHAWDSFKSLFRDKRQLEDILREITPVRSDSAAHFRAVPERDLKLCAIRCSDLCGILERVTLG